METFAFPDGRLPAHWDEVKQTLESLATRVSPDLVLAPRVDDAHQDHRLIGSLATTVWRNALVLHYEIPKWDGDMTSPTHFVGLTADQAHRKVALLTKSFPSQVGHDWWDDEMFLGLMRISGHGVHGRRYAEGFYASKVAIVDLSDARGDQHDDARGTSDLAATSDAARSTASNAAQAPAPRPDPRWRPHLCPRG